MTPAIETANLTRMIGSDPLESSTGRDKKISRQGQASAPPAAFTGDQLFIETMGAIVRTLVYTQTVAWTGILYCMGSWPFDVGDSVEVEVVMGRDDGGLRREDRRLRGDQRRLGRDEGWLGAGRREAWGEQECALRSGPPRSPGWGKRAQDQLGVPPKWVVEKLHAAGIPVMNMVGHPKHVSKALAQGSNSRFSF
ncbi:hypothetical protein NMY22_g20017 [Coprinellus aureogranulatus]|nr:hypothetical protein NMY22_g20017 [Coprinellus aureogranulatus]